MTAPHPPSKRARARRSGTAAAAITAVVLGTLAGAGTADAATTLTVSSTSTTRVAPNTTGVLAGLSVANSGGATIQVTLATDVGTVALPSHANLTLAYANHWSGDRSVTFTGTEADAQTALGSATLSTGNTAGQTAHVSVTASPADSARVYLAPNQHYYEYVASSNITWTAADAAAKLKTFQGQQGYLATIPNTTVNDFISSKIQGAVNVWFGAQAYDGESGSPYARTWRWTKGADESPLAGQTISNCNSIAAGQTCSFTDNSGLYNSWAPGEPNNYGGGEPYAVTNWQGSVGKWNDLKNDASGIAGYVVEYGDRATGSTGFNQTVTDTANVLVADVPAAPTSVSATRGNGQASVTFTAPNANGSAITGYTVTSSPGGKTATCAGSPCVVSGLDNGTSYTFTVVATNAIGDSSPSAASNAVTPATVPGAPTGVTATRGNGSASVSFTAPASNGGSAITSYTVTSAPGGKTATCTGSPCTVAGLDNGTGYTFSVVATNAIGSGAASSASSAVTPATVPGAPTSVTASRGDGSASVAFTPPSSNGGSPITSYTVTSAPGGKTATCDGSPCVVSGLDNGTSYTFTVVATNDVGDSNPSAASNAVTPATVPGAPTGVTATRGNGSASVSFTAPASNGGSAITSYTVTSAPGGKTAICTGSPCVIAGLDNGTSYTFTVVATNSVGDSSPSAASNAVTPATKPDAPTDVVATRGNGSASISFTPPADNGSPITGYTVTAAPGGKTVTCDGLSACIVGGLDNGTSYTFTVVATNDVGDSGPSAASAAVTPATVPGAPGITSVVSNAGSLTVTFTAPTTDGSDAITGYEYSVDGVHWFSLVTTGSGPYTGTIAGLSNGTSYPVRVRAVNSVGSGPASAPVSATPATTPAAATNVASSVRDGQVTVTWKAPTDNGGSAITGYTVTAQPGGITCRTTGATSCTFPALPPGKTYRFSVVATNANGSSTATGVGAGSHSAPSAPTRVSGLPSAPRSLRVTTGDRTLNLRWAKPADDGGARITHYLVSLDGGRHWQQVDSTRLTVEGVTNGVAFRVLVRAVNANGAGARSATVRAVTRQWFHDPITPGARKKQHAVPSKPWSYRGKPVATRNAARSANGTPAMPVGSLHGRQLQRGQAAGLGAGSVFRFDSAVLTAAGKRQVAALAKSLRYVDGIVCEGFSDYGGKTAHEARLSLQRAKVVCAALRAKGVEAGSTVKGYGASRPVVIGGTPADRGANRRVVVLVAR